VSRKKNYDKYSRKHIDIVNIIIGELSAARLNRRKKNSYDYEQHIKHNSQNSFASQNQEVGYDYSSEHVDVPISPGKSGFSEGSGLRSIAQGSADQANNAVANQHAAAKQASYVALNSLSQVAAQGKYFVTIFI
jgi:hypothetical protein